MDEKGCTKCGKKKALGEFHRQRQRKDGRRSQCRVCVCEHHRQYRNSPEGRVVRRRYEHSAGGRAAVQRYVITDKARGKRRAANRRYAHTDKARGAQARTRASHALETRVRSAANEAIRSGQLIRGPCEHCGSTKHIHAHHEDYAKPLEVCWMCRKCHHAHHKKHPR